MHRSLGVVHKLWITVTVLVLMLSAVLGVAGAHYQREQAQADAARDEMEQRTQAALRWAGLTETNAARTLAVALAADPLLEAQFKEPIAATSARISETQKTLAAMDLSAQDKARMAKIAAARQATLDLRGEASFGCRPPAGGTRRGPWCCSAINRRWRPTCSSCGISRSRRPRPPMRCATARPHRCSASCWVRPLRWRCCWQVSWPAAWC